MQPTSFKNGGATLIEVLVYSVLLSMLMGTFIYYAQGIYFQDSRLLHEINDSYEN